MFNSIGRQMKLRDNNVRKKKTSFGHTYAVVCFPRVLLKLKADSKSKPTSPECRQYTDKKFEIPKQQTAN